MASFQESTSVYHPSEMLPSRKLNRKCKEEQFDVIPDDSWNMTAMGAQFVIQFKVLHLQFWVVLLQVTRFSMTF